MNNSLVKFFLICSGASTDILDKQECFIEKNKYIGIGGTVFFTSVLASLSGGYAFYTIFESVITACCFGLLWGLIIFNLDRLIVSSTRKRQIDTSLPRMQKVELKFYEVLIALPRLLLAVVLAIVIATPLELRFFEKEIKAQLTNNNIIKATEIENNLSKEYSEIDTLRTNNKKLEEDIKQEKRRCDDFQKAVLDEKNGKGVTGKSGRGPAYDERMKELENCKKEQNDFINRTTPVINENNERINFLIKEKAEKTKPKKNLIESSDGLLARIDALHKLTNGDSVLFLATCMITLLFILLEIAPIMVKLMFRRGPYDEIIDTLEYSVYVDEQKKISDLNDQINNALSLASHRNAAILALEIQLCDEAIANVSNLAQQSLNIAQRKVAHRMVNSWKVKSLKTNNLNIKSQVV